MEYDCVIFIINRFTNSKHLKKSILLTLTVAIGIITIGFSASIFAEQDSLIPSWIKDTAKFWVDNQTSDNEFVNALQYLVNKGILVIPNDEQRVEMSPDEVEKSEDFEVQYSYDTEVIFKIRQAIKIATNPQVVQFLKSSNQEFASMYNSMSIIDERDETWIATDSTEITPFMRELIENDISDLLREEMIFQDEEPGDLRSVEIILTNGFGVNVAQTGKSTDYRQDDETWWQEAKHHGLYLGLVEYDESADVYSTDIALSVYDKTEVIGVLKIVVDITTILQSTF